MKKKTATFRKTSNQFFTILSALSAFVGLFILGWILYTVLVNGISAFNLAFFTELPTPPGMEGGGLANAIWGTVVLTLIASLIGLPIGLLSGIYLSEFGKNSKYADTIRFFSNILMGTPSIIIGVFVYALLVVPSGHFSGWSGALALSFMMIPVVARTTEDMLQLVPSALREAALALGTPRWKTTLNIVFRASKSGLVTGVLLAVARVSGETAPLLFTALNSPYWFGSLNESIPNLTVTIFNYAMSPYEDWQQMAWGASLLITLGVLSLNLISRLFINRKQKTQA